MAKMIVKLCPYLPIGKVPCCPPKRIRHTIGIIDSFTEIHSHLPGLGKRTGYPLADEVDTGNRGQKPLVSGADTGNSHHG